MKRLYEWKNEVWEHKNLIILSIIFLIIAIILNALAGNYADRKSTVTVQDIILDNIPSMNLDFLFIYGFSLIVGIFFIYPLLFKVKEFHMAISQFSLLVLVRSFFVSLTHLGTPANAISYTAPAWFTFLDFKNALFFSGHTAIPFLGFLLFKEKPIKIFFLMATIIMAATVLLMHIHYSIDVFAALFITAGSYKVGIWIFKKINHY